MTYNFVVVPFPPEKPDHLKIVVLLDGKLAREWEIPGEVGARLKHDLTEALAKIGD